MIPSLFLGGLGTAGATAAPPGGGGGGGTTYTKQYWRFNNFTTSGGPFQTLAINELRLIDSSTGLPVPGPGTAISVTPSPATGSDADLIDGFLGTGETWDPSDVGFLQIDFTLASDDIPIIAVQVGSSNTGIAEFPASFDVYYSEDGVTYTLAASFAGISFPGDEAYTPYLPLSPDTAPHLFWALSAINVDGGTVWETGEVQMLEGGVVQTGGITPSASIAPLAGTLSVLTDGDPGTDSVYWAFEDALLLRLSFEFPSPKTIDGIKLGQWTSSDDFPVLLNVEYSDNGTDWTLAGKAYPVAPNSAGTLSIEVGFS